MNLVDLRDLLPEEDFQTMIVDRAHARGWLIHHDRGDVRATIGGDAGFPDLVLARRGQIILAEVKRATGHLSPLQRQWFDAAYLDETPPTAGVYVWRPSRLAHGLRRLGMRPDPTLDNLEGLPMATPETRWPALDLTEFDDVDVRIVDTFDETYIPPVPTPIPEPEPLGALRHRQTWSERHRQDVDDLRLALGQASSNLLDAIDGCKAVNYHAEVRTVIVDAWDRTVEALRLIDIHDPE